MLLESKWAPKSTESETSNTTETKVDTKEESKTNLESKWAKPVTIHGNEQLVSKWATETKTEEQESSTSVTEPPSQDLNASPDTRDKKKGNKRNRQRNSRNHYDNNDNRYHAEQAERSGSLSRHNRKHDEEVTSADLSYGDEKTEVTDAAKSFAARLGLSVSSANADDGWEDDHNEVEEKLSKKLFKRVEPREEKQPMTLAGKSFAARLGALSVDDNEHHVKTTSKSLQQSKKTGAYETPKQKKDRQMAEQRAQAKALKDAARKEEQAKKAKELEEQRKRIEDLWNDDSTKSMNWADFDD